MGFRHVRRYDVQAMYALVLSVISVVPLFGAAALALRNYHHELGQIIYGSKGLFLPGFFGCLLPSMVLAAIGFLLGWNSAGQRRNDRPTHSWIGFFLGGIVLTLDLILLAAFCLLRLAEPV